MLKCRDARMLCPTDTTCSRRSPPRPRPAERHLLTGWVERGVPDGAVVTPNHRSSGEGRVSPSTKAHLENSMDSPLKLNTHSLRPPANTSVSPCVRAYVHVPLIPCACVGPCLSVCINLHTPHLQEKLRHTGSVCCGKNVSRKPVNER